jgi:hypothetical protein
VFTLDKFKFSLGVPLVPAPGVGEETGPPFLGGFAGLRTIVSKVAKSSRGRDAGAHSLDSDASDGCSKYNRM